MTEEVMLLCATTLWFTLYFTQLKNFKEELKMNISVIYLTSTGIYLKILLTTHWFHVGIHRSVQFIRPS